MLQLIVFFYGVITVVRDTTDKWKQIQELFQLLKVAVKILSWSPITATHRHVDVTAGAYIQPITHPVKPKVSPCMQSK